MIDERQKRLLKLLPELYSKKGFDEGHKIDHIQRVLYWTIKLGKLEKGDLNLLIPAALLHDIGIPKGDSVHARWGAKKAKKILEQMGYSIDEIKKISYIIEIHSQDDVSSRPRTREGNILWDADKMDATGLTAFHRWTRLHPEETSKQLAQRILRKYTFWRKKYGSKIFYTQSAQRIAIPRIKELEDLCKKVMKDYKKFKDFSLPG
jgi:HD superfamily phosphodiesterase